MGYKKIWLDTQNDHVEHFLCPGQLKLILNSNENYDQGESTHFAKLDRHTVYHSLEY